MRFGSICSGIEAASVAWHPLGWTTSFMSEIEPFPRAVLSHYYPTVPLHGDFTTIKAGDYDPIDLLVGGTPCQSFSVAGLRGGLGDDRGNLALEYCRLAQRLRPKWLVWENVPGVLSNNGGRDFGSILGAMVKLGYGVAYRVLDAQFIRVESHVRAVPQRRRRVFVVGYLGDWRRAAAVLLERESMQGHPAPRRKAGQGITGSLAARTQGGGGLGTDFECDGGLIADPICISTGQASAEIGIGIGTTLNCNHEAPYIAHALCGEVFDASEDGTGRGTPLMPCEPYTLAIRGRGDTHALEYRQDGTANALLTPNGGRGGIGVGAIAFAHQADGLANIRAASGGSSRTMVAFAQNQRDEVRPMDVAGALAGKTGMKQQTYLAFDCKASGQSGFGVCDVASTQRAMGADGGNNNGGGHQAVMICMQVRRLTPRECERLMGFPDDYTLVPYRGKPAADGPRYKALGNSMAVNAMVWLGHRIDMVERMTSLQLLKVA